jgi:hypothetical protein
LDKHRPVYNVTKKKHFLNFGIFIEAKKGAEIDHVRIFPVRYKAPDFYFEGPKSIYPWLQKMMMSEGLDPGTFLLDRDREHYDKYTQNLQWKAKNKRVGISTLRSYMLPQEGVLVGPGRKSTEQCAIIVENYRVLGYTYFYLATDSTNVAQLKKRMVHLESDAYTVGVMHHFLQKGYLKVLD